MTAAQADVAIRFAGAPGNLVAIAPLEASGDALIPVSVNIEGRPAIYRASVRAFGAGTSEVRLRLPGDTPPGTYSGEATVAGKPRRIVAEVDRVTRIRIQPGETTLAGRPATSVGFAIVVENRGNVPVDIPRSDAIDLDDGVGQGRALARSLRAPLGEAERRVDRFFEELRESHGGEALVTVKVGAGHLKPGESREIECVLDLPDMVKPGRSYAGTWQLGDIAHVITAEISGVARPQRGRAKG